MPRISPIIAATGLRDGKTMNICAGNRSVGALRPQNLNFPAIISNFWPSWTKTSENSEFEQWAAPYGAQVAASIRIWYDQPSRGFHLLCLCAVRWALTLGKRNEKTKDISHFPALDRGNSRVLLLCLPRTLATEVDMFEKCPDGSR